jgi:hypothetical protein
MSAPGLVRVQQFPFQSSNRVLFLFAARELVSTGTGTTLGGGRVEGDARGASSSDPTGCITRAPGGPFFPFGESQNVLFFAPPQ